MCGTNAPAPYGYAANRHVHKAVSPRSDLPLLRRIDFTNGNMPGD
jgi:hypothetical protein